MFFPPMHIEANLIHANITLRVIFILVLGGKGICIENFEVFLTSIVIKTSEAFAYSLNWMPSTARHDYNSLS